MDFGLLSLRLSIPWLRETNEAKRGAPRTLFIGVVIIALCEVLLFVDVKARGGVVFPLKPGEVLSEPVGRLATAARVVAVNMTVFCWVGYLLVFDGLLTWMARRRGERTISSIRARPNRFIVAWLTSIPVWCFFDWVNFYYMDAWRYHGLPENWVDRYIGYFIAFAAISPGMFLAAQLYQHLGMKKWNTTGVRITPAIQVGVFIFGVAFVAYPFVVRDPIANLTLWVSLIFLLDPINDWLGGPSIIGDWRAGRWGRTLALMAGGATCGFCWEFWNYWAISKWTYHLPFTGALEHYRYFEMPWIGFQGFLPFAIECWVMLNTIVMVMERLRVSPSERLSDHVSVL